MTEDPFVTHRGLLFTVAYEMLGSAADAEDVLQESWLRWAAIDQSQVSDARAYLIRVVTRQALNHMRTLSRRREDYVGEWLPEPLLTSPDVAEDVELAESVSIAMLTVLETLAPTDVHTALHQEDGDRVVRIARNHNVGDLDLLALHQVPHTCVSAHIALGRVAIHRDG